MKEDEILTRIHTNKPLWVLVSGKQFGKVPIGFSDLLEQKGLIKIPTEQEEHDHAKVTIEWDERYD